VVKVFFLSLAKHQNVVKINNHKLAKKGLEHLFYQSHEGVKGISEFEWHNQPFIKSQLSLKGGLPFIPFMDLNLIILIP